MPTYRVCGIVSFDFQHEIEASSEGEARAAVRELGLLDLDNYDQDRPRIYSVEDISTSALEQLAEQAE